MKQMLIKTVAYFCVSCVALFACTPIPEGGEPMPPKGGFRMLIANEGQFTAGTASITGIDYQGTVTQDLFRTKNSRPLGDVAQSIMHHHHCYYVAMNNSRKIEVMSDNDFTSHATILLPDGVIPTYMVHLGGDSMVVADKGGSGQLIVIDTQTMQVRRSLGSVGSTNQMLLVGEKLYLAGSTLRVLSLSDFTLAGVRKLTDGASKTISVVGDSKLVLDKEGTLWALNATRLVRVDPRTEQVVKEYPLNDVKVGAWDGRLDIDRTGSRLYIAGKVNNVLGIVRMNVTDAALPSELLFPLTGVRTEYNMAVSNEETIVVCDVQFGSLARGLVHEYNTKGEKLNTFEAGIFPQYIYFPK